MALPPEPIHVVRACSLFISTFKLTIYAHNSHRFKLSQSSVKFLYEVNPLLHPIVYYGT
jgi:hypothetical protein